MAKDDQREFDLSEVLKKARESDKFRKTTDRIVSRESEKKIDRSATRRAEDWGSLANQVVGSEHS